MSILKLSLLNFRNHSERNFEFSEGVTVIWGENGSGKTSILEAINILSLGKSFKTHQQKNIIKRGEKNFITSGVFILNGKEQKVAIEKTNKNKQTIKINGQPINNRKDLIGRNNIVVLSPEDQKTTKGGPRDRRLFFDKLFSVIDNEYINICQKYNRVLKQRNIWLSQTYKQLDSEKTYNQWDEQIVYYGIRLWELRLKYLLKFENELFQIINKYNKEIKLKISFSKNTLTKKEYTEKLLNKTKKDMVLGQTSLGPHRDNINVFFNDKDIREIGSQGEHKIALTLIKLSETSLIKKETGKFPTLLLDDLFAKLDLSRSQRLVEFLNDFQLSSGEQIQTIITTTDMVNIEKTGIFSRGQKIKTHKLETNCNTLLAQ